MTARFAALCAAALLAGCPEERPDTRRQVPAARVPPAVPVEAGPRSTAPPPAQPASEPSRSGPTSAR